MVKFSSTSPSIEQHVEPKSEGDHKYDEYDHKLDEGVDDVIEDGDVLAKDGHLPHVKQQVNPSYGDGPCRYPPNPAGL